jgi:hypothetical protein
MPQVVKKKRRKLDDGSFEEYFHYLLIKDGDEGNHKMLNLLKKAQDWRQKIRTQASGVSRIGDTQIHRGQLERMLTMFLPPRPPSYFRR